MFGWMIRRQFPTGVSNLFGSTGGRDESEGMDKSGANVASRPLIIDIVSKSKIRSGYRVATNPIAKNLLVGKRFFSL